MGITLEPNAPALDAAVFIAPFASDTILLFMGGFLLSAAITKHGIDRVIAGKILQPFARSPLLLLFGVLGLTAFLSMWMTNTATAAMMIAMVRIVAGALPEDEKDRFQRALLLAVPFGANIGGVGTPIGTPPNAIGFGALNAAGYDVTFLRWMVVMVPVEIVMLAIVGFLLYALFKPSPGLKLPTIEPPQKLTANTILTLLILATTITLWLTSGFHGVKPGVVALLATTALAALGVIDGDDVNSIKWNVLILMWGSLSLGVA